MMRQLILCLLFQAFCINVFSQEDTRLKEWGAPIPAHADVNVRWVAPTNLIPPRIWIYRILPNKFSPEIISNLMTLCGFTEKDEIQNDSNALRFKNRDNSRQLGIFSPLGVIDYGATFRYGPTNLAKDVPPMDQMPKLTTNLLAEIGISSSDIERNTNGAPNFHFWEPTEWYFVNHAFVTNIEFRAVNFRRAVDGIAFSGAGTGGDCGIHLGEYGKVSKIDMSWRNLERYKDYPTITPQKMIDYIRKGKAVHGGIPLNIDEFDWSAVKSITIKKAKTYYYAGDSSDPSDWLYPFAALLTTVDTGHGNVDVEIDCPIIDETNIN